MDIIRSSTHLLIKYLFPIQSPSVRACRHTQLAPSPLSPLAFKRTGTPSITKHTPSTCHERHSHSYSRAHIWHLPPTRSPLFVFSKTRSACQALPMLTRARGSHTCRCVLRRRTPSRQVTSLLAEYTERQLTPNCAFAPLQRRSAQTLLASRASRRP